MLACVPLSALGLQVPRASIRASAATAEASTGVSTAEVAKLFGRFAENVLHLDRDVGACCHSACSDCEWRTPDGGYRWDVMKAMQPKWVGCYRERDFEDQRGCHAPKWATTLFAESDDIGRDEFAARLRGMEYAEAMGPKGKVLDAMPSDEVLDLFWETLAGADAETLSFQSMRARARPLPLLTVTVTVISTRCQPLTLTRSGCRTCRSMRTATARPSPNPNPDPEPNPQPLTDPNPNPQPDPNPNPQPQTAALHCPEPQPSPQP